MNFQMTQRWARAIGADNAAFLIEAYVDKAAAERYRKEIQVWVETGISPYIWDNAMPLVRECEEAE